MNTTHQTTAKRLIASVGVAAAAAVAPALLFVSAGTAAADDSCYGSMMGSYYCSPASGGGPSSSDPGLTYTPVQPAFGYNNLPGCSGGALAGVFGALSGDGC